MGVWHHGLMQEANIRIIPIHLLRDDPRIKVADDGSKMTDTDDWQVDYETFQKINRRYRFTIDLLASDHNTLFKVLPNTDLLLQDEQNLIFLQLILIHTNWKQMKFLLVH